MAQQQYHMPPHQQQQQQQPLPPSATSPAHSAVSTPTLPSYSLPTTKRLGLSPDPRPQPPGPYIQSPYITSPHSTASPLSTSPYISHNQLPNNGNKMSPAPPTSFQTTNLSLPNMNPNMNSTNSYNTPYSNGSTTPFPTSNNPMNNHYSNNGLHGATTNHTLQHGPPQVNGSYNAPTPTVTGSNLPPNQTNMLQPPPQLPPQTPSAGVMGPPLKPVEKEVNNDDQTDVLANAGVDLRAEENFAMSFYTGSYNSQPGFSQGSATSGGQGFSQFQPGDASSFYGAGPANQPGAATDNQNQDEVEKKAADKAWADAAHNLARSREHELSNPHVTVPALWAKMDKIARENGVSLNVEASGKLPTLKLPSSFPAEVNVRTVAGPHGAVTTTGGKFLPPDTALADQLALMSLATNQRIRILLEDAVAISRGRRTGSDGTVPSEWAKLAIAAPTAGSASLLKADVREGWESAISPLSNPRKRKLSVVNRLPTPVSDGAKTPRESVKMSNELAKSLRDIASTDRKCEERRLQKRLDRANGVVTSGSAVPGTPANAAAPEPSAKPLTKKEREKQDKGRQSLVDTHAQANSTMNIMLGGGSKKKKYSWMTAGGNGTASGGSTPGRLTTSGLPGMGGAVVSGPVEPVRLTADGISRPGGIREHNNTKVELRDWVLALENDGMELRSLQVAYTAYGKR